MTLQNAIDFANQNPICFLATAEGDQPRVRAMGFWRADETGFYFQTGAMKRMTKQIGTNPKIEACFYHSGAHFGKTLRIAGTCEFIDDLETKSKVLDDRPFLRQFGLTETDPNLVVFRITKGEAEFWTMDTNFNPESISFEL